MDHLKRRKFLVDNFDYYFEQVLYFRLHKDVLSEPKIILWKWDELDGQVDII